MPNWALLLVRLALGVSGSALMTWAGWKLGQTEWALIAFVFSTPLIGIAIARPLVEVAHDGLGWLAGQPLGAWHGRYYAFDGVHIRVLEDSGELWFCAKDILAACGLKLAVVALPGLRDVEDLSCLSMEGLEALHRDHPRAELGRLVLWARREVVTPWERKRSGALVPR
ncbi:MAG TPA: hypothetical protein VHQ02_07635 [Usitatibacter sp.]|jgi:hypothetical protein|nr:hypothetical protein [Usitatibacter sp.]